MVNIIINEQALSSDKKTEFAISKAVSKIGELQKRHGDVSVSFSVPLTAKNSQLLGGLSNLNKALPPSARRIEARAEEAGEVISEGYVQILGSQNGRVNLRFYGGNSSWFAEFGEDTLKDLNLGDLDHEYKKANVIGSFSNTEGYKYILYDNGKNGYEHDQNNINTDPSDYLLTVYVKTLFNKIFNSKGLRFEGNMFEDPFFASTLVSVPAPLAEKYKNEDYIRDFGTVGAIVPAREITPLSFDLDDKDAGFDGQRFTFGSDVDNLAGSEVQFVLQQGQNQTGWSAKYAFYKSNGYQEVDVPIVPDFNIPDTNERVAVKHDLNAIAPAGFLPAEAGDYIELMGVEFDGAVGSPAGYVLQDVNSYRTYFKMQLGGNSFFPTIDVQQEMPEMKITDFIKDVMFRSGAFCEYNESLRTVKFTRFDSIAYNYKDALDWTNKIDHSKKPKQELNKLVSGYGKANAVKYKEDEDDIIKNAYNVFVSPNKAFGDGVINIENDFIPDNKSFYESPFASTVCRWSFPFDLSDQTAARMFLPFVPQWEFKEIDLNTGKAIGEAKETASRILLDAGSIPVNQIHRDKSSINIKDFDEVGSGSAISSVGYAFFAKQVLTDTDAPSDILNNNTDTLAFDTPVGFPNDYTLLEKNYTLLNRVLNSGYKVGVFMLLQPHEVARLDHTIPVYLNLGAVDSYFYVEEIRQYRNSSIPVLVNLVKI